MRGKISVPATFAKRAVAGNSANNLSHANFPRISLKLDVFVVFPADADVGAFLQFHPPPHPPRARARSRPSPVRFARIAPRTADRSKINNGEKVAPAPPRRRYKNMTYRNIILFNIADRGDSKECTRPDAALGKLMSKSDLRNRPSSRERVRKERLSRPAITHAFPSSAGRSSACLLACPAG